MGFVSISVQVVYMIPTIYVLVAMTLIVLHVQIIMKMLALNAMSNIIYSMVDVSPSVLKSNLIQIDNVLIVMIN